MQKVYFLTFIVKHFQYSCIELDIWLLKEIFIIEANLRFTLSFTGSYCPPVRLLVYQSVTLSGKFPRFLLKIDCCFYVSFFLTNCIQYTTFLVRRSAGHMQRFIFSWYILYIFSMSIFTPSFLWPLNTFTCFYLIVIRIYMTGTVWSEKNYNYWFRL